VDLVQDAEGAGLHLQQCKEEGDGCQRLLTAGEGQQVLEPLAGRLHHDVDPRLQRVVGIGKEQVRLAAAEQAGEGGGKSRPHFGVDVLQLFHGLPVDAGDHLVQLLFGLQEVISLGGGEGVALFHLFVLFHAGPVDRPSCATRRAASCGSSTPCSRRRSSACSRATSVRSLSTRRRVTSWWAAASQAWASFALADKASSSSLTALRCRRSSSRRDSLSSRCLPAACARAAASSRRSLACRRARRSEEHTSELQSRENLVCRLLLETKI